jgi:hypothetical protein
MEGNRLLLKRHYFNVVDLMKNPSAPLRVRCLNVRYVEQSRNVLANKSHKSTTLIHNLLIFNNLISLGVTCRHNFNEVYT